MWHSELKLSLKQYLVVSILYASLIITVMGLFFQTCLDWLSMPAVIALLIDWWRAACYFSKMHGELALFYDIRQLYWARQRWYVYQKPLFLYYFVIISIQSKRNGNCRVLFLSNDNLSPQDWRSLHYFLRQFYVHCN